MSRFSSLRLAEIRPLLTSIGSRTSGTKAHLLTRLERDLRLPKLTIRDGQPTRILSVDMGIKNLAFCVCDVQKHDKSNALELNVLEWKKIGVLDGRGGPTSDPSDAAEESFGPSAMSAVAWRLMREVLWPWSADTMLIERQRFRSGGSSAVFEWTLRVNMLESMIWAISRSLCASIASKGPEIWPVSPKQVAGFWVPSVVPEDGRSTITKSKIEKKQKIDLVHTWLADGTRDEKFKIDFRDGAAVTRSAFLSHAQKTGKRIATKQTELLSAKSIGKLDDLADCLLQAAAWCKWEQNRNSLASSSLTPLEGVSKSQDAPGVKRRKVGPVRRGRRGAQDTT